MSRTRNEIFEKFDHFGKYQILQYLWISLSISVISMSVIGYVFVAENIKYRCRISECENENYTVNTPNWWPVTSETNKCLRPVLNITHYNDNRTCSNSSFLNEWEECTEWVYENENSVIAGLNLGCQAWMASLVGSCHNAGMIAAMILAGWLADKFGRKPAVIICSLGSIIGVVKIFLSNMYAYLAVEFIESFLSSGIFTVAVVLLIEVGGESKRVLAGVIFSYASYFAEFVYAFLAMGLQSWKYLILVCNVPAVFFLCYGFILKESTRWQMLRGKMDEAKENLKAIAKMNKLDISEQEINQLKNEELRLMFNVEEQKEKESLREIVRSKKIMLRLLVVSVCFFTSAFVHFGLLVHTVYLPGNKYTNFALSALASFPGDMLAYFTFKKYGRKITLQCGHVTSAIFIIAQAFTPETLSWLKIILFLCGKFTVVVTFTGIFTYSMELFPTSVRGFLVGCGSTAARVGSMLSPLTPLLTVNMVTLPSILFASTCILSAALLFLTPETKHMPLLDTVAQVEAYKPKDVSSLPTAQAEIYKTKEVSSL